MLLDRRSRRRTRSSRSKDRTSDPDLVPFTRRAKAAISAAVEEARKRGDDQVGSPHLLLGLLDDRESLAVRVVESLGVPRERLRDSAARALPSPLPRPDGSAGRSFSKSGADSLAQSLEEALRMGTHVVSSGHLLLGLAAELDSQASRILAQHGIIDELMRHRIEKAFAA